MVTPTQNWHAWPDNHSDALKRLVAAGRSYSEAADALNAEFGTAYTRNSCIGRGHRLGIGSQFQTRPVRSPEEKRRIDNKNRRERRWAKNPDIARRYGQEAREKNNREIFLSRGATTTSAEYRRHIPRISKELTRADLRAMLAQAMQNTAAMEIIA